MVPALFVAASAVLLYYTFTDNLRELLARLAGDCRRHTRLLLLFSETQGRTPDLRVALPCAVRVPTAGTGWLPKDKRGRHVYPLPILPYLKDSNPDRVSPRFGSPWSSLHAYA